MQALAIAAHPDDIEFLMAGTLCHLAAAGVRIHYWTLADGCCGSDELDRQAIARVRRREAEAAAAAIGATYYPPLCHDLEIFYDQTTLARVAAVIRRVAPDLVLTHSPLDYMEDHMNTARLAVTATFARGMPNFPVEPATPALSKPVALYHAQPYFHRDPLGHLVHPDFFVDVSSVLDRKLALLECHHSQRVWLDRSQGQDAYTETLRQLDAECGAMSGRFPYAEGWRRHWHIGFATAEFDPLRTLLPGTLQLSRSRP